jgi:hypothetical protein
MEGHMLVEREEFELQILRLRQERDGWTRQDTQMLMSSWHALAQSLRLLDRQVHKVGKGELHVVKDRRPDSPPMLLR